MGFLDNVKVPGGGTAGQPTKTGGFLANVKVPQDSHKAFAVQGASQQYANARLVSQKEEEEQREYHPIRAFLDAAKSHDKKNTEWMPSNVAGETVKETWGAFRDATKDLSVRAETAFRPAVDAYLNGEDVKKADVLAGLGSLIIGGINVGFSPVTGFMKGAETIPVIGHVASLFNKFAYGLGGAGAETFGEAIESAPFLDDETKVRLRPVTEEIGSIVGLIFGFRAAGKLTGKIANSRIVRSRIDALERKAAEVGEILRKDTKLNVEVARFVAERGPVRNVPVTSETPGSTRIPATPNQKHAAYSERMGYEPYTPESKLPVIDAGTGGGGGGAPSRVSTEGLPVIDATGRMTPTQETLPTLTQPAQGAVSATPAEAGTLKTGKAGAAMQEGAMPKATEPTAKQADVVTVNQGTYRLSGDTLARYQQAKAAYDASVARLNAEYTRATAGRRQQIQGQLKALGMQWSASLREMTGNLTATELGAKLKFEKTNYKGKKVIVEVNGKKVEGEVIGTAYGRIKVRLKDGTEVSVTKDKVTDPRTADEIKAEVAKREGVEEYDPTKTEEPAKKTDEQDITVEPIKEAPMASPEYNQLLISLELAEAGKRVFTPQRDSMDYTVTAQRSTFPEWMPENAKRRTIIDKYLKDRDGSVNDANIKYKEGSVLDQLDKAVRAREERMIRENEAPIMESTVDGKPVTEATTPEAMMGEPTYGGGSYGGASSQATGGIGLPQAIQGSGPTRTPSVTRRAIDDFAKETADNLDIYKEADPRYGQMNIKEDAGIAHKIAAENPSEALDLAFGRTMRNDVTNVSVWRVLIEQADRAGNTKLVLDLARSPVAQLLVRGGQEAVALRGLGKFNASKVIADIEATQATRFQKRRGKDPKKQVEEDIAAIEKSIMDTVRNDPTMKSKIIKFLEENKCK